LIFQNIKNQTDIGKKAQDILVKGEAVPESIVAKMIDDKINSPEVAHHGTKLDFFFVFYLVQNITLIFIKKRLRA
jgi:adenylate/nucleoside-diphosphate kinase